MITKRDKEIFIFIEKHKGITINQASKIFFSKKNGYDSARLRLKKLFNSGHLVRYINQDTKELVYTFKGYKELSPHNINVLNFYAELISHGAVVNKFDKEKTWITGKRSDGFFEFIYNNSLYLVCLEVDFTHDTNINNKYVALYDSNQIQEMYKDYGDEIFPKIIIMTYKTTEDRNEYPFLVSFIDFNLNSFVEKVLL